MTLLRSIPILLAMLATIAMVSGSPQLNLAAIPERKEGSDDFDPYLFLEIRSKQMRDVCPTGIERCHCLNNNGTYATGDSLYYERDPIGAVLTYVGCNPDFCWCKDSPTVERDSRPPELAVVMDLCPRGMMSRCLCHDNSVAKFPFDMSTFFFQCRPKRCKCKGENGVKKVTGLGCKEGGTPFCPNTTDKEYFCKDGSKVFINHLLKYQLAERTDCICADGIAPRCRKTGEQVVCPDGAPIDFSIGKPGNFLDGCRDVPFQPKAEW